MSIEAAITVTLASVEVEDDYMVAMTTRRKRTRLTADEALKLADELSEAAIEAHRTLQADHAARVVHLAGFDVAPVCRECQESKHGACNGQAVIEVRGDIEVHACGCSEVDHAIEGRAS